MKSALEGRTPDVERAERDVVVVFLVDLWTAATTGATFVATATPGGDTSATGATALFEPASMSRTL